MAIFYVLKFYMSVFSLFLSDQYVKQLTDQGFSVRSQASKRERREKCHVSCLSVYLLSIPVSKVPVFVWLLVLTAFNAVGTKV